MTAYTIKLADMPDEVEFSDDWLDEMIRSSVARLECTNEELRLLRRTEGLIAENQKLREALKMASHAIDNWVCLYAPDECGEGAVKAALVDVEAGVLVYTADVKREIRAALKQEPKL